jgi:hypothetical protein
MDRTRLKGGGFAGAAVRRGAANGFCAAIGIATAGWGGDCLGAGGAARADRRCPEDAELIVEADDTGRPDACAIVDVLPPKITVIGRFLGGTQGQAAFRDHAAMHWHCVDKLSL